MCEIALKKWKSAEFAAKQDRKVIFLCIFSSLPLLPRALSHFVPLFLVCALFLIIEMHYTEAHALELNIVSVGETERGKWTGEREIRGKDV